MQTIVSCARCFHRTRVTRVSIEGGVDSPYYLSLLCLVQTAEHVLGSVLCAPGCFSVYRCRALADVLPKYAKRVESAFDFLTKDMGEDRWLCTLMVRLATHTKNVDRFVRVHG